MSIRVGLNLLYLVPGETGGTETVARELIPALLEERPGLDLTAFVSREGAEAEGAPWNELIPRVVVGVNSRRRAAWVRGEQQLLPGLARREGVEVLHSLANTGPARGAFRKVVSVQDLIHRIHPEAHFGLNALGMRFLVSLAARTADRVIAPSSTTRSDLVRLLGISEEKIDVIPLGTGSAATASPLREKELRRTHDLGDRRLILSVSASRPHKNLPRLVDALALIPPDQRPVLVVPGYPTPRDAELRERADGLGVGADLRFPGWVSAAELEGLYAAADAFVFPSLYEGFGFPVLEAMSRGVPVACSERGPLPEVAGKAAIYFDPEHPDQIAAAIRRLLSDPTEAKRLRKAGVERAARFTWRATARATLEAYERALSTDS